MSWQKMKSIEPELEALEQLAQEAGRDGRSWWETWTKTLYEPLTKIVGPACGGRFTSYRDFERCHRSLLLAWSLSDDRRPVPPWELDGETVPLQPALFIPDIAGTQRGGGARY